MNAPRELSLIAAHDERRVIGHQGQIPWHYPLDMQYFRKMTLNHAVIMGRSTYESLRKPLAKRSNIVMTRKPSYEAPGCHVVADLPAALEQAYSVDTCPFIIGGEMIYRSALPQVTTMYITRIPGEHEGDTFFPAYEDDFVVQETLQLDELTFVTLRRRDLCVE